MDGVLIVNKPRLTGGHCAVRTLLQDFGEGIFRRQPQFQSSISRYNKRETQSQRRRKGWNLRWIPVSASWRCDLR